MSQIELLNGPAHGMRAKADLEIVMKVGEKKFLYRLPNQAYFVRELTEEEGKPWVALSSPAQAVDSGGR